AFVANKGRQIDQAEEQAHQPEGEEARSIDQYAVAAAAWPDGEKRPEHQPGEPESHVGAADLQVRFAGSMEEQTAQANDDQKCTQTAGQKLRERIKRRTVSRDARR